MIAVVLIILINVFNNDNKKNVEGTDSNVEVFNILTTVENKNEYGLVKKIIDTYFLERANLSDVNKKAERDSIKEKLFEKLDREYLESCEITQDNLYSKLKKVNKSEICITNLYMCKKNEKIVSYFVNGYVIEKELNELIDMNIIITLDKENMTYEIQPTEYVKESKRDSLKLGDEYITNTDNIEIKDYNVCSFINATDNELALNYFETFKEILYVDKDVAYGLLNEEYRNKRFGSIEKFKEYCNEDGLVLINLNMNQYSKIQNQDYNDYVYIGDRNNYYIIRENGIGNIEVFLDTYTINTKEFISKYNQVSNLEKAELNIQKYINAINVKDYQYAYDLLDDSFKANYFKTIDEFKKYIDENYFDLNKVEFKSKNVEQGIYLLGIAINDVNEQSKAQSYQTTMIIRLNDNYDFDLSFKMK